MEKVKLPNEICDLLDKGFEYYKEDGNNQLLWSALQSPYIDNEHILKKLRIFSNQKENATLIAKAILYGYEPEETEEERKEREMRENFELIVHNYLLARVKRESEIVRYSKEITDMFFQCKK